jgi:cob(I)alamin adenosyltransferase
MTEGYIQIYTGDGKGKTTAAIGLCVRAAGAGARIYFAQFMKDGDYNEVRVLANRFPEITIASFGLPGFFRKGEARQADMQQAAAGLEVAHQELTSGNYGLVVLDELCVALFMELVPLEAVLAVLDARPTHTELVLTGRRAHPLLIERAQLVSEIVPVKHYYELGVDARPGIEM